MAKSIEQESELRESQTCLDGLSLDIRKLYDKEDATSLIKFAETFLKISDLKLQQRTSSDDVLKSCTDTTKHLKYVDAIVKKIVKLRLSEEEALQVAVLERDYHDRMSIVNDLIVQTISIREGKIPQCLNADDEISLSRKSNLQEIREKVKEELQAKETEGKRFDVGSEFTENIYKYINNGMKHYLADLFKDAEKAIGEPPCRYSVVGLGSMALGQMTPYSDLEFAILTENEDYKNHLNPKVKDYFKNLSHYVHFKVILLGESVIPTSDYEIDLSDMIAHGVQFDLGGKTPLGRLADDKPYELIQTVEGMMHYLRNENNKQEHRDKNLPYILEKVSFVTGDDSIVCTYQQNVEDFMKSDGENNKKNFENRSVERLFYYSEEVEYTNLSKLGKINKTPGNVEQFDFDPWGPNEGKIFDIKQEIYRLADRFIYNLGLIHGIVSSQMTTWDVLNELCKKDKLSEPGRDNLIKALNFANMSRLIVYGYYSCQKDEVDLLDDRESAVLFRDLSENSELFKFFYRVLPLMYKLEAFARPSRNDLNTNFFKYEDFYDDSSRIKGGISIRLLNYTKASEFFEENLRVASTTEEKNIVVADILNNLATVYYYLENYDRALEKYENALIIRREVYGNNHVFVAMVLNNIGNVYSALGRYEEALEKYKEAQVVWSGLEGDATYPEVAVNLDNIGYVSNVLKKFEEGENSYQRAIEAKKKMYCADYPGIASSLDGLGYILSDKKEYDKALEKYKEALKIRQTEYGRIHPSIAISLNNIAHVFTETGRYEEALVECKEVLRIREKIYGNNHLSIAHTLNNLGFIYSSLEDKEASINSYKKSLEIRLNKLGESHLSVVQSFNSIGNLHYKYNEYSAALENFKHAIDITRKLNVNNGYMIELFSNIAATYEKLSLIDESIEAFERALDLSKEEYKDNTEYLASAFANIGLFCERNGRYEKAVQNYKVAFDIDINCGGEISDYIAGSLKRIGNKYFSLQRYSDALEQYEESLKVLLRLYVTDHKNVAEGFSNVAAAFSALGKKSEALEKYEQSLKIRKNVCAENDISIAQNLSNIGAIYFDLNKYDQALENYEKALIIRRSIYDKDYKIDISTNLNVVAAIYYILGDFNHALENYKASLDVKNEIYKELQGVHPSVADILNSIGAVYSDLGLNEEALTKYEEALSIRRELYGNNHPDVAMSLNNIGKVYSKAGNDEKALDSFRQSLEMSRKFFEDSHVIIHETLLCISESEAKLGVDESTGVHENVVQLENWDLGQQDIRNADDVVVPLSGVLESVD